MALHFQGSILFLLALLSQRCLCANLRGVNPEVAARFVGSTFTCLDDSRTIPIDRVNDDYCDCPDGSDEPGTSACYNGRFYCRNLGHEPKSLSASFVDDGVCDCCDGTDEVRGRCSNTCLQQSASRRAELQAQVGAYQATLSKKQAALAQAEHKLAHWTAKQPGMDDAIAAQEARLEELKAEKARLEAERDARQAAEEERLAAERAAEEAASAAEEAAAAAQAAAAAEAPPHDAAQAQPEGLQGGAESAEEIGRRIASQWTNDPEAAAAKHDENAVGGGTEYSPDEHHADEFHSDDHHHDDEQHHDDDHHHDDEHDHHEAQHSHELNIVIAKHNEAERELLNLRRERDTMNEHLSGRWSDYGPGNVFLTWAGQCFTSHSPRWTYEACPFGSATQSEPGGGNRVSVGTFQGFENNYTEMVFGNGDMCAGIGPRTFRVKMECAHADTLSNAEEPATCQYTAHLTSPLLCTEAHLQHAHAELEELLETERQILADIEAQQLKDEL